MNGVRVNKKGQYISMESGSSNDYIDAWRLAEDPVNWYKKYKQKMCDRDGFLRDDTGCGEMIVAHKHQGFAPYTPLGYVCILLESMSDMTAHNSSELLYLRSQLLEEDGSPQKIHGASFVNYVEGGRVLDMDKGNAAKMTENQELAYHWLGMYGSKQGAHFRSVRVYRAKDLIMRHQQPCSEYEWQWIKKNAMVVERQLTLQTEGCLEVACHSANYIPKSFAGGYSGYINQKAETDKLLIVLKAMIINMKDEIDEEYKSMQTQNYYIRSLVSFYMKKNKKVALEIGKMLNMFGVDVWKEHDGSTSRDKNDLEVKIALEKLLLQKEAGVKENVIRKKRMTSAL